MQGQSSPVQVKDLYTGSILMHVGSSCKTHRSVQCTPPKNNQKLIGGSNRKGSVSASGTGRIRLESPRPAMSDTEPILTGTAPCPALNISYQFLGCK